MAMVNVLAAEDLVDPGPAGEYLAGLDEVLAAASPFTPEAVEDVTGVDADTIRTLARDLAAAPTACVYGRIGTTTALYGTLTSWLVDVLNALTGNLDRPGGAKAPPPRPRAPPTRGGPREWAGDQAGPAPQPGPGPARDAGRAAGGLPGRGDRHPGRGPGPRVGDGGRNLVLSTPNAPRLDAALATLDFYVAVDPYVNETTQHADVILPVPTAPEGALRPGAAAAGPAQRGQLQPAGPPDGRGADGRVAHPGPPGPDLPGHGGRRRPGAGRRPRGRHPGGRPWATRPARSPVAMRTRSWPRSATAPGPSG